MNSRRLFQLGLVLTFLSCIGTGFAAVRVPKMFSDHAVLQRDAPIHIWGWADPGEQVTVSLASQGQAGQKESATADDLGKWSVYLAPEKAGGPYTLTIQGTNTLTISDILMGDVWFASGQSNMEMPLKGFPNSAVLKDGPQEIANANQPELRLLRVHKRTSDYPLPDLVDADEVWTLCTPETAADFSAVAYFFGREIQQREKVPVGLIDDTWGGTPAEAWISLDGISANYSLMPVFTEWSKMANTTADLPAILAREKREDEAAKAASSPLPKHAWHPNPSSWAPAYLYNGMVAPFVNFSIKGAIWYQGESNSKKTLAPMYSTVFPTLIADWRSKWREGDFPFLYVQISSFTSDAEFWGIIRDAQRRTLSLVNTGMAVTSDIGQADNVHPPDKQTVGHRLALAARDVAYGEHMVDSGPLFRQAFPEGSGMRVLFDQGEGLNARGGALTGFEIAGDDHKFVPASAAIQYGHDVVVSAPQVKSPKYVRYAWANYSTANLYNGADLPASTFSSESSVDAGTPR